MSDSGRGPTPSPGQLVRSRAGRDRGGVFIVVGTLDERHVLVADGQSRRVARAKKKNICHLEVRGALHAGLAARLASGRTVGDREVRAAIQELVAAEEADD